MPRIYDSANDPLDFCKRCMPGEKTAEARYANVAKTGEGPDGRGNCFEYNAEHPPYEDTDYRCVTCKRHLGENDNECTR
jgi:hypothetical protein